MLMELLPLPLSVTPRHHHHPLALAPVRPSAPRLQPLCHFCSLLLLRRGVPGSRRVVNVHLCERGASAMGESEGDLRSVSPSSRLLASAFCLLARLLLCDALPKGVDFLDTSCPLYPK